jgi:hypothetical protein
MTLGEGRRWISIDGGGRATCGRYYLIESTDSYGGHAAQRDKKGSVDRRGGRFGQGAWPLSGRGAAACSSRALKKVKARDQPHPRFLNVGA